jgi:hypothetical protein
MDMPPRTSDWRFLYLSAPCTGLDHLHFGSVPQHFLQAVDEEWLGELGFFFFGFNTQL